MAFGELGEMVLPLANGVLVTSVIYERYINTNSSIYDAEGSPIQYLLGIKELDQSSNTEIKTDWYVGPEGEVAISLDAYDDYMRMISMNINDVANQIVTGERIGSGLKDDTYHKAASYVSKEQLIQGSYSITIGVDGTPYFYLKTLGELNGQKGYFEYYVNYKGQVTHQLFKKN